MLVEQDQFRLCKRHRGATSSSNLVTSWTQPCISEGPAGPQASPSTSSVGRSASILWFPPTQTPRGRRHVTGKSLHHIGDVREHDLRITASGGNDSGSVPCDDPTLRVTSSPVTGIVRPVAFVSRCIDNASAELPQGVCVDHGRRASDSLCYGGRAFSFRFRLPACEAKSTGTLWIEYVLKSCAVCYSRLAWPIADAAALHDQYSTKPTRCTATASGLQHGKSIVAQPVGLGSQT